MQLEQCNYICRDCPHVIDVNFERVLAQELKSNDGISLISQSDEELI